MSNSYLDNVRQGKNSWWRYGLGILLILFLWLIVGGLVMGIISGILISSQLAQQGGINPSELQQQLEVFLTTPSVGAYISINIPFLFFILGIFLVLKWLHRRPFRTLISVDGSIHVQRLLSGFGVWFLLSAILIWIDYVLDPQNYLFAFNPAQWFVLLPLALVLTPLQTSTEEVFFRGYLLQGLSLITRQKIVLIIISSLLFAIPHFANPEMQRGMVWQGLSYFAMGIFWTVITLKDNRLELALGVHAAHNLQSLFFSTKDSVLPIPAIWMLDNPGDPKISLVFLLVNMAIFYYIFFGKNN